MNPYRYSISLRAWHPTKTAEEVSIALPLKPKVVNSVGTPRTTPKGGALTGFHPETFLSFDLGIRSVDFDAPDIEEALSDILQSLQPLDAALLHLRETGGRQELFIGLFGDRNFGFELRPDLLSACGALGLGLSLDIYP